jgi:nitrate reductase gamma subunit
MNYLNQFFFGYFPYIALGIFVIGSALRYDRDQYSWKADSSQLKLHLIQCHLGCN